MTKQEFISNYFFKTSKKTIYYLLNKYKWNLDVIKIYLNNLYVIDEKKEYKYGIVPLKENNVCIDINGLTACTVYSFKLYSKKISIYFNLDNTCNINIIDVDGDEKIYNNIPYRINLRKEIGFDFSKYDDLENGNDSFVIDEVNDELKIQMINGSGDVFEFNVV